MRTYLPFPSVTECVQVLHPDLTFTAARDILDILDAIHEVEQDVDLSDHPEVIRWKGHAPFLAEFGTQLGERMRDQGYVDFVVADAMIRQCSWHYRTAVSGQYTMKAPAGWGDSNFHDSEKSALLRLKPKHYGNIFPGVRFDVQPYWMMSHGSTH